jgi:hypothetical protein
MRRPCVLLLLSLSPLLALFLTPSAPAAPPDPAAIPPLHQPAARDVTRYGPAYRYPQAGWVVLHVEGEPYARGYQQGRLLAKEIAAYIRMLATERSVKAPADGWKSARQLANALFLRKIDREYLEEMRGIAEGATDAGASYDERDIDLVDIVAINTWMEIECLDPALDATPTGLERKEFPRPGLPRAPLPRGPIPAPPKGAGDVPAGAGGAPAPKPVKKDHCSAFIANGAATADGKIVFGHITMSGLTAGPFVNVWIDVQPKTGRRFVMQAFPGAVWSSQDYYINGAGILLCETTIDQTPFDPTGTSLVSRARKAIQYGDSIDAVVKALSEKNNGLYSNEWLIGDLKTNEIAMFELGTQDSRLWRSSKDQWFEDTKGFYWGCNNAKDLMVRIEAQPADTTEKPERRVWEADERDRAWLKFYKDHAGKIDGAAAKKVLSNAPLAANTSLDAKYTTAALAQKLASHAMYGPPHGKAWKPTIEERRDHPEIKALEPHPWTVLTITPAPK